MTNPLREALRQIAYLRPSGNIADAKDLPGLIEQMERIALDVLDDDVSRDGKGAK